MELPFTVSDHAYRKKKIISSNFYYDSTYGLNWYSRSDRKSLGSDLETRRYHTLVLRLRWLALPKSHRRRAESGKHFYQYFAAKDGSFSFDLTGKYDEVIPHKKIVYTMGEMKEYFLDAGRKVTITFEKLSDRVFVTETFDAEEVHSHEMQIAGWQAILENFKKYVEMSKDWLN